MLTIDARGVEAESAGMTTTISTDAYRAQTDASVLRLRSQTYIRYLSARATGRTGDDASGGIAAMQLRWPDDPHVRSIARAYAEIMQKAATTPGTTTDPSHAALAALKPYENAFLAVTRPQTLIGRIRGIVEAPFNSGIPVQTSAGVFSWSGQSKPKGLTRFDFGMVPLGVTKVPGIIVLAEELLRLARPGTEALLERCLADGIAEFLDRQFTDPAVAAVADVNPASVTNGIAPIAPSGTTAAALVRDVGTLLGQFFGQNPDVSNAALLMTPGIAGMLIGATNSQTATLRGGTYAGVDLYPSAAVGTTIVALDASMILLADGGVEFSESHQTTLQMDSAPTDPPTAATVMIPLWQNNLVALRAERFVNWRRARASAVSYISPIAYVPGT